ncbi:MAG: nonstructural protein [Arizlama microvirus]|nr:MAG: nonstructural protein [Arizlama microvirus]
MILSIFAVKDNKASCYNRPFAEINVLNAVRGLSVAVNNQESQIMHFPEDFDLYQIGTFDDVTGKTDVFANPKFIQSAIGLKKAKPAEGQKEVSNA